MGSAVGVVEVVSLSRAIDAANTAVNAAAVEIVGMGYALPGVVMVTVRGSVDAVGAAVAAVRGSLEPLGALHGSTVLARPAGGVEDLISQRQTVVGSRAGAPKVPGRGRLHAGPTGDATADRQRPSGQASATETPAERSTRKAPAKKAAAKKAAKRSTAKKATKSTGAKRTSKRSDSAPRHQDDA